MTSHGWWCLPKANRRTWQEQSSHIVLLIHVSHFLCVQHRAEVVSEPNGSQIIFSGEPGGSSRQQILTSPELTHEVVISPGLPTPPLSPFRASGLPYGEVKVCTEAGWTTMLRWSAWNSVNKCSSLWKNDASQAILPALDMLWNRHCCNCQLHYCYSYKTEILV